MRSPSWSSHSCRANANNDARLLLDILGTRWNSQVKGLTFGVGVTVINPFCKGAYQNARKYSDPENIRIEGELAVQRAISTILSDYIELFQQFTQNAEFKKRLISHVLALAHGK